MGGNQVDKVLVGAYVKLGGVRQVQVGVRLENSAVDELASPIVYAVDFIGQPVGPSDTVVAPGGGAGIIGMTTAGRAR